MTKMWNSTNLRVPVGRLLRVRVAQRDGPSFAKHKYYGCKIQGQRDRSSGESLFHEGNKETNRRTPITEHQKEGYSRGHQTKLTEAPDTGHRHARTPTASNRTRTRISHSSFWDKSLPDQKIPDIDGARVQSPVPRPT